MAKLRRKKRPAPESRRNHRFASGKKIISFSVVISTWRKRLLRRGERWIEGAESDDRSCVRFESLQLEMNRLVFSLDMICALCLVCSFFSYVTSIEKESVGELPVGGRDFLRKQQQGKNRERQQAKHSGRLSCDPVR